MRQNSKHNMRRNSKHNDDSGRTIPPVTRYFLNTQQITGWQAIYFCEFDGPRQREVWIQTR